MPCYSKVLDLIKVPLAGVLVLYCISTSAIDPQHLSLIQTTWVLYFQANRCTGQVRGLSALLNSIDMSVVLLPLHGNHSTPTHSYAPLFCYWVEVFWKCISQWLCRAGASEKGSSWIVEGLGVSHNSCHHGHVLGEGRRQTVTRRDIYEDSWQQAGFWGIFVYTFGNSTVFCFKFCHVRLPSVVLHSFRNTKRNFNVSHFF